MSAGDDDLHQAAAFVKVIGRYTGKTAIPRGTRSSPSRPIEAGRSNQPKDGARLLDIDETGTEAITGHPHRKSSESSLLQVL